MTAPLNSMMDSIKKNRPSLGGSKLCDIYGEFLLGPDHGKLD